MLNSAESRCRSSSLRKQRQDGRHSSCYSRRQEGSSQIQAKDRSHLQEQGPQTRPEGVRTFSWQVTNEGHVDSAAARMFRTVLKIDDAFHEKDATSKQISFLYIGQIKASLSCAALETTSQGWRVWAQTSPWFVLGKHLGTWSSATWLNTASCRKLWVAPALLLLSTSCCPHQLSLMCTCL